MITFERGNKLLSVDAKSQEESTLIYPIYKKNYSQYPVYFLTNPSFSSFPLCPFFLYYYFFFICCRIHTTFSFSLTFFFQVDPTSVFCNEEGFFFRTFFPRFFFKFLKELLMSNITKIMKTKLKFRFILKYFLKIIK